MKKRNTHIAVIIAFSMLIVCAYQMYWMVGQYLELKARFREDITEALRSADFEELAHRVEEISQMIFRGNVQVKMGYDHGEGNSVTHSEIKERYEKPSQQPQEGTQTTVNASSFGSILKTPEDLTNIGLNMQRGIHLSLDAIKEVNIPFLDGVIAEKLDSLGLSGEHELIYIRTSGSTDDNSASLTDTLAKSGNLRAKETDIFTMRVSEDTEYRMIIPNWHIAVLKKMMPVIIFSLLTLLLLITSYLYMLRTMRKQREMEEIKTDFTNNITHELKTPIAVAYAANDALLNYGTEDKTPRMNRYLQVCQEQLRLLDRLVEQILSISMDRNKGMLLNMEDIDINELLHSLAATFKFKYPDAAFSIDVSEGLTLRSDRMHLSNITGNLIDNAVKYSKGNADVTLKAYREQDGRCTIEVTDKGMGISKEQQKYIFDRFYRVPHGNIHDVKGYGLGLFYVRSMTERLGGTVSVKSTPGKGSTFTLNFNDDNG